MSVGAAVTRLLRPARHAKNAALTRSLTTAYFVTSLTTSLISPIRFPSESRKNVIHKS
jgi:hypothetical protein